MNKAIRILWMLLLGVSASAWLGATGVAPVAAVAPATAVAPVAEAAPAAAPVAVAQAVAGEGAGAGFGSGSGGGETVMAESGGSYLGVDVDDVTKGRMAELKLKEERGVVVNMVDQDAPAGKAGLKERDVILEFNGARVESVEQLRRMIREIPPGRNVTLGISRDGQPMTLNATLADRSKSYNFAYAVPKAPKAPKPPKPPKMPEMPEVPEMREFSFVMTGPSRSGLLVENLTPQLGEYFGVKDGAGVLVRSVEKGSAAEAAGFKAGDIIIRVEQEKVADKGDWRSTMHSHRSGKVAVGIIRDRKEQTLSLALPDSKDQSRIWRFEAPDMEDLDMDLEDMDIEINRLGPEMEKVRPEMERMKKELSAQLTARLTQDRDQVRKMVDLARAQQRAALATQRAVQLDAVHAAQRARVEVQRALELQRKELDKARQMMLQQREMD